MHQYMFNGPSNPRFSMTADDIDFTKPVRMEAGRDSFDSMGPAPASHPRHEHHLEKNFVSTGSDIADQWQMALLSFVANDGEAGAGTNGDGMDFFSPEKIHSILYNEYAESAIDALRRQKDEELLLLRVQQQRQKKLQQRVETTQ